MAVRISIQIDQELKRFGAKASKAVTSSAKSAWKVAVNATPRDTGLAQSGWKLSTTRRTSYVPRPGIKSRPNVPQINFRITKDKRLYMWNNVPYVYYLEHGLGPEGARTPHAMLQKASAHFESDLRNRLRALR